MLAYFFRIHYMAALDGFLLGFVLLYFAYNLFFLLTYPEQRDNRVSSIRMPPGLQVETLGQMKKTILVIIVVSLSVYLLRENLISLDQFKWTDLMARFANIGIGPGLPFDAEALDAEVREALGVGINAARETVAAKIPTIAQQVNGWTFSNIFGTRKWYSSNFLLRAVAAMAGWGGNDVIEAMYPTARVDAEGNPLDGAHRYQLTFTTPPPAKAFWSVTMYDKTYDGAAGYLVENPINRYLINSTTPGLVYGKDDSLTITIQREQPQDATQKANWLPAPEGPFYLVMRIYWPEQAALDGSWTPPSVKRLD